MENYNFSSVSYPFLVHSLRLAWPTPFSAFVAVQFLTCISTVIDVATHRPTPTPFGTQHIALLLAAWGPVVVFGVLYFMLLDINRFHIIPQVIFPL